MVSLVPFDVIRVCFLGAALGFARVLLAGDALLALVALAVFFTAGGLPLAVAKGGWIWLSDRHKLPRRAET